MCFSATASFITAAALIPVGIYSLNKAFQHEKNYLALAAFPLFFGIQQLFEGGLWLALEDPSGMPTHALSMGFLFFAYFFWPFWVPVAALLIEKNQARHTIFLILSVIGFAFGASLYVPLFIYPEWMSVSLDQNSIVYEPALIYDGIIPRAAIKIFYAAIVAISLLFSSVKTVRIFGIMIFTSVVGTAFFFAYAFVSIWCFFAAILSAYIVYIIHQVVAPAKPQPRTFDQA